MSVHRRSSLGWSMKVSVAFSSVTLTLTERRPPALLARYLEREKTERSEVSERESGSRLLSRQRMNERRSGGRTDYLVVVVVDAVNDILSDEFEDAEVERRHLTYMVQARRRPSSSDALCAIQIHFAPRAASCMCSICG